MNCTECIAQLDDFAAARLAAQEAHAVDAHLAGCPACRGHLASLQTLRQAIARLPREIPPARDLWPDIEPQLTRAGEVPAFPPRYVGRAKAETARSRIVAWFVPLAVAASIVMMATLADRSTRQPPGGPAWSVASLAGSPRVGARPVRGEGKFRVGQWLETDANSRARVSVGSIGEVSVEPNSRLRLVDAAATEHRLELARGTLHAMIFAPPRLFFVDTPSATAVDLGCAYTLTVAPNGDGELHVTTGYVALEHEGHESIVPAGARCLTRKRLGPGTPFAADAPEGLRAALRRFDFERDRTDATLRDILVPARADDAVTLWHLLARTAGAQRAAVYEVLARLHPPPDGVTREGILGGNRAMRSAWGTELGLGSFGILP